MIKTKLISSELYKSNMKKGFLFALLLLSACINGQTTQGNASTTSIGANFSMVSVKAYQESANLKVSDYYKYLELLSDSTTSEDLKNEIKNALFAIVKNRETVVSDITSDDNQSISLTKLIDKIQNKNYTFSVFEMTNGKVYNNSWSIDYRLKIFQNNTKQAKQLSQIIYFSPTLKHFGSKTKEVWSITLGEVRVMEN